jgi:hypothetical protein
MAYLSTVRHRAEHCVPLALPVHKEDLKGVCTSEFGPQLLALEIKLGPQGPGLKSTGEASGTRRAARWR